MKFSNFILLFQLGNYKKKDIDTVLSKFKFKAIYSLMSSLKLLHTLI